MMLEKVLNRIEIAYRMQERTSWNTSTWSENIPMTSHMDRCLHPPRTAPTWGRGSRRWPTCGWRRRAAGTRPSSAAAPRPARSLHTSRPIRYEQCAHVNNSPPIILHVDLEFPHIRCGRCNVGRLVTVAWKSHKRDTAQTISSLPSSDDNLFSFTFKQVVNGEGQHHQEPACSSLRIIMRRYTWQERGHHDTWHVTRDAPAAPPLSAPRCCRGSVRGDRPARPRAHLSQPRRLQHIRCHHAIISITVFLCHSPSLTTLTSSVCMLSSSR